ncbi:hypothetical protein [Phreatobacter stygius]|uniref:Uncharacterized protein n=1 Tax=Phreatobacter stygius TaxID=1940610 RepID=A0A4D7B6F8_9HYPH|nr:hypothetical protein [Phreatobacter stygius]QCI65296.1 hypothetical protein E8M01_14395 [Phreatobacter stygius]
MARTTYYVMQPFRLVDGEVVPGEPVEKRSAESARTAARLAGADENGGAIAFARSGDPELGDFEEAEILARFGIVPDEFVMAQG